MKIQEIKRSSTGNNYKIKQDFKYAGDDLWNWWIWIDADDNALDKIDNVVYNLHYTFRPPVQVINTRENKFKLSSSGWGTFTIYARINLKDTTVVELDHDLELYYPNDESSETPEKVPER